jgi:hypothetical protein
LTAVEGIISISLGGFFLAYGLTGKQFYGGPSFGSGRGKPIPRWMGCLVFVLVGVGLLWAGISNLIYGYP